MGQEIVHCSVCGLRLCVSDFERGKALRIEHTSYCRKCAPQAAPPSSPPPSSTTTRKRKNATQRIAVITPKRPMNAVQPPTALSPALLWGGAGLLAAVLGAVVLAVAGGRPRPAIAPEKAVLPPPEVVERGAAPTPPPSIREKASRAEKVRREMPATRAELAELDRNVADASSKENFREAFDLLKQAAARHDTLEWTAEIQKRSRDLENSVRTLYFDLKAKLADALSRGADAEAGGIMDRIARWNLPGYGATPQKPAAKPPDAPPPAPGASPTPPPAAPPKADLIPFSPGPAKWSLLTPQRMSATDGVVLTLLEDGTVLAGGPNPPRNRYALAVQTDLKGINGFRVEVLPDRSMAALGPGRSANGNIVLTEFQVYVISDLAADSGAPVALAGAAADFSQDQFPVTNAIDGKNDTGWGIMPQFGRAHEALFDTKAPITAAGPLTLLIVLDHQGVWDQHTIGRFRISATTSKSPAAEMVSRGPVIDQARVDQAIQRGVAWLRRPPYPPDYAWTANELILWTFVHAGVPESDPDFQKRLKQMLESPLERTYRVALQAMILEELDRVAYQLRLWQCAQFLVDNQCLNGQWLYGTPTEFPKGVPTPAKAPVATGAKLDSEGRRIKPKVARRMIARKTRDGPPEGDNSNSQYAALGLRACFDAGIVIPEETIHRAVKWWMESQYFDEKKEGDYAAKGWSYTSAAKEAKATHTMTAGAISSLTIYDYLLSRDWKKNMAIRAGVNWIAQSFVVNNNYYYLYGLERAGVLYGIDKFGRYPWYLLGAQWILDHQDASGGWITHGTGNPDDQAWNTWDTCFAILFLKRATRPLVSSEDRKAEGAPR